MRLLVTDRFLEAGRSTRRGLAAQLAKLPGASDAGTAKDARAATLPDGRVVIYSRERDTLKLWYLLTDAAFEGGEQPFSLFSADELQRAGVPGPQVQSLQRADALSALHGLGLGDDVVGRLGFLLLQQTLGALPTDEALRRRALDLGHLDEFLHGRLEDLLLGLDEAQSHIVDFDASGALLIRGVAGSGKTTVLLQRLVRTARQGSLFGQRLLFLTFNRALASVAKQLLRRLGLDESRCEVSTVHAWCRRQAGLRGGMTPAHALERALAAAVAEAREADGTKAALWSYPLSFWKDEVTLIKGRVQGGRDEYRGLPRHGAGRRLDAEAREKVWRVYEAYERLKPGPDWDDVVRLAWDAHVAWGAEAERYDAVVVDEAQDLSVVALRLIARLPTSAAGLTVAYDPAQSIFQKGFRWKDCGIAVHGRRSFDLTRNHRNTREILDAARALLVKPGEGAEDEWLEPERVSRSGPPPRVLLTRPGAMGEAIAADVRAVMEARGLPPQNVAVVTFQKKHRDELFHALRARDIEAQRTDADAPDVQLDEPAVKVLTMMGMKGLEFPFVYLCVSWRHLKPRQEFDEAEQRAWLENTRRVLYVGMTRPMSELVLVCEEGQWPPLLERRARIAGP